MSLFKKYTNFAFPGARRGLSSHKESKSTQKKDIKNAKARTIQTSPYTKGQQALIDYLAKAGKPGSKENQQMGGNLQQNQLYKQATGLLGQYLNPNQELINKMQAPQMRQYNEQVIPEIAQRYASSGAMGSSGFMNAATNSAADLQERLNAQQLEIQQGALSQALGYAEAPGIQNQNMARTALGAAPNQYTYIPPQQKGGFLRSILPAVGAATGAYFGGPAEAAAGGAAGNQMSQSNPYNPPQRMMSSPINSM